MGAGQLKAMIGSRGKGKSRKAVLAEINKVAGFSACQEALQSLTTQALPIWVKPQQSWLKEIERKLKSLSSDHGLSRLSSL